MSRIGIELKRSEIESSNGSVWEKKQGERPIEKKDEKVKQEEIWR